MSVQTKTTWLPYLLTRAYLQVGRKHTGYMEPLRIAQTRSLPLFPSHAQPLSGCYDPTLNIHKTSASAPSVSFRRFRMKWIVVFILAAVVLGYLAAGAFLFQYLEGGTLETRNYTAEIVNFTQSLTARYPSLSEVEIIHIVEEVLIAHGEGTIAANNTIKGHSWDLPTSFFFVGTVITTIGYGNVAPATVAGRVATIFYGLIGIPLCLMFLSGLGEKLVCGFRHIEKCFACCSRCDNLCHFIRVSVVIAVGWILFLMIPAAIFMRVEGWTFIDSVYFCFVTLSTIGFGDLVVSSLQTQHSTLYRVLTVVWVYVGLAWLSSLISLISEIMQQGFEEGDKKVVETIKMTHQGIKNKLSRSDSKIGPDSISEDSDERKQGLEVAFETKM